MTSRPVYRRREAFTLTEVMVSIAIMGVVMVYLMQSFTTQHRTYVVLDQVSEAQQNLRAIADLLESEIRTAGFMVPEHGALCGSDLTTDSDVLIVSDASAINPEGQKKANLGAKIQAIAVGVGSGTAIPVESLTLDGEGEYDSDGNGTRDSDFQCVNGACTAPGELAGGVIVVDANNPERGVACGIVERIAGNTLTAEMLGALGGGGTNVQDLRAIPAHVYRRNAAGELLRDNLVLVGDVDDFQVAWFFDLNENGRVDAGEYRGIGGGTVYAAAGLDASLLREVRANVIVRTHDQDERLDGGQFQRTENRQPVAGDDGFRRRVLTATVELRNVGSRG